MGGGTSGLAYAENGFLRSVDKKAAYMKAGDKKGALKYEKKAKTYAKKIKAIKAKKK